VTQSIAENREPEGGAGLERIDPVRDAPRFDRHLIEDRQPPEALSIASSTAAFDPTCSACGGAGWFKHVVPFGHPNFGQLVACTCTLTVRSKRLAVELRKLSNLAAFADKTFATFSPFVAGLRAVLPMVLAYAQHPDGWLSLIGPYGVGKTHLAAAIANDVLGRGEPVLFVVVPDLLDHLRATFGPDSTVSFDERFTQVRDTPLLILDDLGTESATPWAREKLYQLINHRYNWRLATVITSNLKPDQLDPRIYSRMCDRACGQILMIAAGDYRRREGRPETKERHGPGS
jgi:DNA replication protein DnaC